MGLLKLLLVELELVFEFLVLGRQPAVLGLLLLLIALGFVQGLLLDTGELALHVRALVVDLGYSIFVLLYFLLG